LDVGKRSFEIRIDRQNYMTEVPINQILCGNCNELLDTIQSESIDLTITSPPYGNLRDYHGYVLNTNDLSMQLLRITKPGGIVVWVVGDETINGSESGESFKQALQFIQHGWLLHDTMIYAKSSFSYPSTKESMRYHQQFEFMFIFSKGKPKTFNPIMDKLNAYKQGGGDCKRQKDGTLKRGKRSGTPLNKYGMRNNIWTYVTGGGHHSDFKRSSEHPATFPDQLAIDHIKSWSNKGDLILDPMCGSGTTCAMAYKLGRNYIGIDISPDYCQLAKDKIKYEEKIKAGEIF